MRSIACRRMIQKEAPFVRSGASFETRRLRRRLQDEEVVGVAFDLQTSRMPPLTGCHGGRGTVAAPVLIRRSPREVRMGRGVWSVL